MNKVPRKMARNTENKNIMSYCYNLTTQLVHHSHSTHLH